MRDRCLRSEVCDRFRRIADDAARNESMPDKTHNRQFGGHQRVFDYQDHKPRSPPA
jgi:hypothetical protein